MNESKHLDRSSKGVDPRWLVGKWFFFYRAIFYVAVAFLVRESVVPARSAPPLDQSVLSSEFTRWSATFPSRLDRAMETGVAE